MKKIEVSDKFLKYRDSVLRCTNEDINLRLDNSQQVYIAVFDIPVDSGVVYGNSHTLALIFGLNTHIYYLDGSFVVDLEKNSEVMKAMQSLLISSHQALGAMKKTTDYKYYESNRIRAYLKTKDGVFFKELEDGRKEDDFLKMLLGMVTNEIAKCL